MRRFTITGNYPLAPQLSGARAKIQNALAHYDLILAEVDRVTGTDAYSVPVETEDDGRKHVWRVKGLKDFDERMPLWIGDCLHNLRSAWDHVAYELIKQVPGLQPCRRTMFPLLAQEPVNPVYILPNPGPHPDAVHIVQDVQPYNMGHTSNALAILDHLDIVDKHRELLAVAAAVEIPYYGSPEGVKTLKAWGKGDAVADGDVVMWALIDPPQPKGALIGNVVLETKLAQEFMPVPLHLGFSLKGLVEEIARQLEWRFLQFDWFFATHT
jgi:hypothetical protein